MEFTSQAVIVIPVYKVEVAPRERLSLSRCQEVLGRYPIVFVGPRSLDFSPYLALCPEATVTTFEDRYFSSLESYSALLVTTQFYEAFLRYEYLLIYQPDAWVFEDRLAYWCGRGYDYIGAPFLGDDGRWSGVGNGGFSLRRVAGCLQALTSDHQEDPELYWRFMRRHVVSRLSRALRYHRKVLKQLGFGTGVGHFLRKFVKGGDPEDLFWSYHAVRYSPSFRVAPVEESHCFSVEAGLERLSELYAEHPPFGCHRDWFLEMLERYLNSPEAAKSDYEALVWRLAELSGMPRCTADSSQV